ncbi:MAG: hypothetical protein ACKO5Q_22915, partial [Microcystaceae cyanobacterium]
LLHGCGSQQIYRQYGSLNFFEKPMGRASKVNFKAQGAQNSVNSTEKAARNPKQGRTTSSWMVKQRKPEIEAIAKVAKEKRSIIDRPNEERKK